MKSLVSKAQEYHAQEMLERQKDDEGELFVEPRIVVVGCGGAGNNTVHRLKTMDVKSVETIAINTDMQHLEVIKADKKVLIGRSLTKGLGAGGYPDVGKKAAELARGTLEELLCGAHIVFVVAGMGGGTGTGSAPVVAEIAKNQGAIVLGVAQYPFKFERARLAKAEEGLEELKQVCDTVIVLDNNRLLEYVPNLPVEQAFSVMDQIIAEMIVGLSETITTPSLVNIDYADVRAVMGSGGVATIMVGESKSQDRVRDVVRDCLTHPLLDIDCTGATGALIHITGGKDLTVKEAQEIVEQITYGISPEANVIWGVRLDPSMEGLVRVMAIVSGVKSSNILPKDNNEHYMEPTIYQFKRSIPGVGVKERVVHEQQKSKRGKILRICGIDII